jgi:glycosyltransferase involved in cell wall biosynthesis
MTMSQQGEQDRRACEAGEARQNPPRLSVILCTYNRRTLVLSALASLRRQTLSYALFEVLVIDNGSSDGTLEAVRAYVNAGRSNGRKPEESWSVRCLAQPQHGLAYARLTGLAAATGEIAVFLDDDTLADPHLLEGLLRVYAETGADAVGGRVELRWEAQRPFWLGEDMLTLLGYFAPAPARARLRPGAAFSSCCFSVTIEALHSSGYFSPVLSKRRDMQARMEVQDLCERLQQAGHALWYEPGALVFHRAPAARLSRAYVVGRSYWQGRAEVLCDYVQGRLSRRTLATSLPALLVEMRQMLYLAFILRPLLHLGDRPTRERLEAAMLHAQSWGRLRQHIQLLEHAPMEPTTPAILLVHASASDPASELLATGLASQEVYCTATAAVIPLSWLWRHRAYGGNAIGIIHLYGPGAWELTQRQRQRLRFRLWLARRWGIRIVTSDSGGWWQSTRQLSHLARRVFERNLLYASDVVLVSTLQPEQLYPDRRLRRRLRRLAHPGFRGYYAAHVERREARSQIGLPPDVGYIYLCLAYAHTERELVQLLETFADVRKSEAGEGPRATGVRAEAQLLLVGRPADKPDATRILRLAALNPAVHLHLGHPHRDEMPLYLEAADALVLPHSAQPAAGSPAIAFIGLSYGRAVVAPRLPRFEGLLPPAASVLYEPGRRESLLQAMLDIQGCAGDQQVAAALQAESSWELYAQHVCKLYTLLLHRNPHPPHSFT